MIEVLYNSKIGYLSQLLLISNITDCCQLLDDRMQSSPSSIIPDRGTPLDQRLETLRIVDNKIIEMLRTAQNCIGELTKEKQIAKGKMDESMSHVKRVIAEVDRDLGVQLDYLTHVCVGAVHQGSTFVVHEQLRYATDTTQSIRSTINDVHRKHFINQIDNGHH